MPATERGTVAAQARGPNSHPLQLFMAKELLNSAAMLPCSVAGIMYRLHRKLVAAPSEAERGHIALLMVDAADLAAEVSGCDARTVWRLMTADAVVAVARAAVAASACPALQALQAQVQLDTGTNRMRNATSLLQMCSLGDVSAHSLGTAFADDEAQLCRIHAFVRLRRLRGGGMRLRELTPSDTLAVRMRMCLSTEATAAHEHSIALALVAQLAGVEHGQLAHAVQKAHQV